MPQPIHPELPKITSEQKMNLIQACNTYPVNKVLHYIETGEVKFSEMPNLTPDRKAYLETSYQEWLSTPEPPDPNEIQDWEAILDIVPLDIDSKTQNERTYLHDKLEGYVNKYSRSLPEGNHVEEAINLMNSIDRANEYPEWSLVDKMSYDDIKRYLDNHPGTAFFADAECFMWGIVSKHFDDYLLVQKYLGDMRTLGIKEHIETAEKVVGEYASWQEVKASRDIFRIDDYLNAHPDTPFKTDIKNTILSLKPSIIQDFKNNISNMSYLSLYERLVDRDLISRGEFIREGIVSESSLRKLEWKGTLPPINQERIVDTAPENHTDVFMFGIPSTGKTCILMGLLGSSLFDWNSRLYGGDYASQLNEYLDAGQTPDSTNSNFVSLVNGSVLDGTNPSVKHPVNIIDMAGEAFAERIADNPDNIISFEDMGIGATQLLSSKNDKVFFIIVDPTTEVVEINKRVQFENGDGSTYEELRTIRVSQKSTLKKLVDLFVLPENEEIMKHVKSIQFIVTKSDMLGDDTQRIREARQRMKNYYQVLNTLRDICRENRYAINVRSNYLPKLYTFSLGHFYLGGVYDYDSADADKILNVIRNTTKGKREKTFVDKVKDALNKKIL